MNTKNFTAQNSAVTAKPKTRGRPFPPGVSGNPGGRPSTAEFSRACRDFLAEKLRGNKTRQRELLMRLFRRDPRTLLAYAYGKPVEPVDITGAVGPQASGIFVLPDNGRGPKPPFDFAEFAKVQAQMFGGILPDTHPNGNGDGHPADGQG